MNLRTPPDEPGRELTRRAFVRRLALVAVLPSVRRRTLGTALSLRIGVIAARAGDAAAQARTHGLEMGLDEARHAATLFGGTIELVPTPPAKIARTLSAVVGGASEAECAAIGAAADRAEIPYLNVACTAQSLREAACRRSMFHIIPSDAMYRDATALAAQPAGHSTAWDAALERFGADSLNQRFQERFHEPMSEQAWTAWFAVKVLWESSLRARSATPGALIDYLRRDTTQFDGHKGRPLSFRAWDNQLRQPMYVIRHEDPAAPRLITEVPASHGDDSSRDVLDRVGGAHAAAACNLDGTRK
jgi:hypothetical protein